MLPSPDLAAHQNRARVAWAQPRQWKLACYAYRSAGWEGMDAENGQRVESGQVDCCQEVAMSAASGLAAAYPSRQLKEKAELFEPDCSFQCLLINHQRAA
jgi:hypothetical protein